MSRPYLYSPERAQEIADFAHKYGRNRAQAQYSMTDGQLGGLMYRLKSAPRTARLLDTPVDASDPLSIAGDTMIVGDVHVPATDYELCQRMVIIAMNYLKEPRQLIIAGDLFNLDFLSSYPPIGHSPEWKREKLAARALINEWLTVFGHIYMITGNHERRLAKNMKGQMSTEDLMEIVTHDKRVIVSDWGHCLLKSGDRAFRVSHGRNYSVSTGTVGSELANKFQTHMILHHQHHASISLDRYKRYIVVDNGAMVDQAKLAYVVKDDGKNPNMARGFTLVRDGEPQLFAEGITVWKHYIPQAKNGKRKAVAA